MNIRGIYKTSLIDFPGKICTVLFSGGCNLRCRFCHNPDLADNWKVLELASNEEAIDLIRKRKKVIDAVTISGGEPTLSLNIDSFFEKIKELGMSIKLDSNGLHPEVISRLIGKRLLDYAAIDIKTSPEKYRLVTGTDVDFSRIVESIDILRTGGIDYEVRTTSIPGYVTLDDFAGIRDRIGRVRSYCLQQFHRDARLLDRSWESIEPYPVEKILAIREFVLTFADRCELRGI
ncbi:MAG: anaerobic ribonucleoside-triphosphate reductase activating protein [Spirochaetes bacterium RBG_13_51_14]|nr:MAG: anaerobic ribonucleoside-triphosphate reductase activating protein [Spirochaetes bacterium RBG_13_51_14]